MEKKTRIVKNSFSSGKNILTEEKELKSRGISKGDPEWEEKGIARCQ